MKIGTWSEGFSQLRGRGIDLAGLKPVGGLRRQQQMVDAQALVLLVGAGLIIPERVAVRLVVAGAERVGQPEIE